MKTKETKKLKDSERDGPLMGLAWSPDGTRVAHAHRTVLKGIPEFKVFVANADEGNATEVYKSKWAQVRAFIWK